MPEIPFQTLFMSLVNFAFLKILFLLVFRTEGKSKENSGKV